MPERPSPNRKTVARWCVGINSNFSFSFSFRRIKLCCTKHAALASYMLVAAQ